LAIFCTRAASTTGSTAAFVGRDAGGLEEPPVGRERVVDGGGEGVLGRAAVIEQQRAGAGRAGDRRREMAVRPRRTDHVPAAVEVEHHRRARARRAQPLCGRLRRRHALDADVRRRRERALGAVVGRAQLLEGQPALRRQLRQVRAHGRDATLRHRRPPLPDLS
jgi:hypothetical protein